MSWGGIKNVPPGYDAFGGKQAPPNIVDEAMRGKVPGLGPGREYLFADLKRNLLHQDYARYFDSSVLCAGVLAEIEEGKYLPAVLKDIVEPALATALDQLESIKSDVVRSRAAHRSMLYDPLPSMGELHRRAAPIATAYPQATGAGEFESKCRELIDSVRAMLST